MENTNLWDSLSDEAKIPLAGEESKPPQRASLFKLYKFLTGPYYILL